MSRTPMRREVTVANLLLLMLVAACAPDAADDVPDVTMRMEDGVTIVENAGFHVADSTSWSIDPTPLARIGRLEGPPEYLFGDIEDFLVLPSGEILIADGQTSELRLFDREGNYLRTVGRRGEGPGEFQGITGVALLDGDSIAVIDELSHRIDILTPDFEFVRRFRVRLTEMHAEPPLSSDMMEGIFANGDPFMGDYMGVCRSRDGSACGDSVRFSRTDASGEILARTEPLLFDQRISVRVEEINASWRWPLPQPIWDVGGESIHYLDIESREIRIFDDDATLERRIRVVGEAPTWTRDEAFPTRPPPDDPRLAAAVRGIRDAQMSAPLPDPFPTFSDLVVDGAGFTWALEYRPPAPEEPSMPRWYVFDPEGRLRYAVPSPPGLVRMWRPTSPPPAPRFEEDLALGLETDELGVESVVVYRLRRGG